MRMPGALIAAVWLVSGALGAPPAETPEEAKLLARANLYRAGLDLAPLARDEALSTGCRLHAEYMDRNNAPDHDEDPARPGYTADGAAAGLASVLAFTDPETSVDMWMDSFLHRIPCITMDARRAGVAWHAGKAVTSAVLDTDRAKEPGLGTARILCWPPPDTVGVPTQMSSEQPNPTPYPDSSQAGYPVTVSFHPARKVTAARGRLLLGTEVVTAFFTSPEKPTRAGALLQQNSLALIPEKGLSHNKVYRAEFSADVDGEPWQEAWNFRTGNRRDGFAWMEKRRAEAAAKAAAADATRRKADEKTIAEARRALSLARGVLRSAPPSADVAALAEARRALAGVPEATRPDCARDLADLEREIATVEERLAAVVRAAIAEGEHQAGAGNPAAATAALDAAAARVRGHVTSESALDTARARIERMNTASAAAGPVPAGWRVLLVDRVTDAWMRPEAPDDHVREEGGAVVLDPRKQPVALAYAHGTETWTDWELTADVEVTGGAYCCLRARLAEGTFEGTFCHLDPTPAGAFTPLTARMTGDRITIACGAQTADKKAETAAGGVVFLVQHGQRLKLRNVRVRVPVPGTR